MFNFEEKNIKKYLCTYWEQKKANPSLSEREVQEKVVDVYLKTGRGPKSVESGKQYLDRIWPNESIDIAYLIFHLISFDFSGKYNPLEADGEDIYEMEKRIREGKKDKWQLLEEKIQRCSKKIQTKIS